MTLEEFRKHKALTHESLAALLGIDGRNPARTVQRYCAGRVPSPDMVRRIHQATLGLVRPQDWYHFVPPEEGDS